MFNYYVSYQIKGSLRWTRLNGTVRPFSITDTLDETLDSGVIKITGLAEKPDIEPFTLVRIRANKVDTGFWSDWYFRTGRVKTVKNRYQENNYLYDTEIQLIELTKELERVVCDSMTFTNYLGKNYTSNATIVIPTITYNIPQIAENHPYDQIPYYYSVVEKGVDISVIPTQDKFGGMRQPESSNYYWKGPDLDQTVTVTSPSGAVVYTQTAQADAAGNLAMPRGTFTATETGVYTITYSGYCEKRTAVGSPTQYTFSATYVMSATENIAPKTDWTITSVVNRILAAGKTRRDEIESQRYVLSDDDTRKYNAVLAPELYCTRSTLFDALLTVGGAIHAIPRLTMENSSYAAQEIKFIPLGGNEVMTITEPMIYEERVWDEGAYCGAFDSTVENMVNTVDRVQGAVLEPSKTAFKTVRCSPSETKINADTMCILTDFPINQVTGLWVSAIINGVQYTGDISAYVFEKAEYDALTGYTGAAYPYSKAYALCYSQGDNKITGLNFRVTGVTSIDSAFQNYAIKNIIKAALGQTIGDTEYITLGFRVQYIPIVTARIKQLRPTTRIKPNNELIYNQGGNSVESSFYGEKLRGAAARLGNETVTRTYVFDSFSNVPSTGSLVDVDGVKMYVAVVNMQCDAQYIRATLVMTPNYNKLSEWVGINSNYRLYDVSEKQSVDRLMNYGEVCVIGTEQVRGLEDMHPFINDWGIKHIKNTFTQTDETNMKRPRCAEIYSLGANLDNPANVISRISLPLSSGGLGNSLYFSFNFADNYGAGHQARGLFNASSQALEIKNNRISRNVPYGDVYGEVHAMAIKLQSLIGTGVAQEQTNTDGGANILPEASTVISTGNVAFSTGDAEVNLEWDTLHFPRPFLVMKDSRERIGFTYQQHFQTMSPDIVVGKSLTQNNLLITDSDALKSGVLYLLPEPLNILRQTLTLTRARGVGVDIGSLLSVSTNKITLSSFEVPANATGNYKAWAIVNPLDKTFYIGMNEDLSAGDTSSTLYMNFTDNSYYDGYAQ